MKIRAIQKGGPRLSRPRGDGIGRDKRVPPGVLKWLFLSAVALATANVSAAPLPGEPCTRPAIAPDPFPDRLSAYVWRNWGLVEPKRLAAAVGATEGEISAVAADMGLASHPTVLPEWRRKGYITILRRNWQILPYDQLLTVLDMTREELTFRLMEDDFLWHKLGNVKPKCDRLAYDRAEVEKTKAARRRLAEILREEGFDPSAPEEPRFTFAKELSRSQDRTSNLQPSPSNLQPSPFDFRLISSYFADYADPLGDPEISSFPEGLLQRLSAEGVNAVWLHVVLRTLARDAKYPEFGEGCEARLANLQKLVDRCARHGVRVFLYMNEPRGLSAEFYAARPERAALKGAPYGLRFGFCTSTPETLRWLRDSLAHVFSSVHGLGGIFTITMSENFTHCGSRDVREKCPRCRSRRTADLIVETNRAMVEGMVRGDPKAEALVWNWAWPKEDEADIVSRLPKDHVRLMAVSENAMEINRGGIPVVEGDYSISIVGPGDNARRFWSFARDRGIPAVAKVQTATSWELGSFPYLPTMDLVAEHAANLAAEGVTGVMLAWSVGSCPSPNLSVYRLFEPGPDAKSRTLDRLAESLYGAKAPQARKAWTAFSQGFTNYPFCVATAYNGPHHWGVANPLYLKPTGYRATMVGIPYDGIRYWSGEYPPEVYADLIGKVAEGFAEGCRLMEGAAGKRELDMYRAEQMHFASSRDQALFVLARDRGDIAAMKAAATRELKRARAYWPIVRADSRIGYESSNHYFFIPRDVLEKVLSCRQVLALTTSTKEVCK